MADKNNNLKPEFDFDKYQRNIWKAQAIQNVAENIGYYINSLESDIQSARDSLAEYEQKEKEEAGGSTYGWRIEGEKKTIEEFKIRLGLYKKVLDFVDKEMAF